MNSLIGTPLEKIALVMAAILIVSLVISAIGGYSSAVFDIADACGKPLEGLGVGIETLLSEIGQGIGSIFSGIGQAIVRAVDNITSAAAIQGIITAICSCF